MDQKTSHEPTEAQPEQRPRDHTRGVPVRTNLRAGEAAVFGKRSEVKDSHD